MSNINRYIASAGTTTPPSADELSGLVARYPWCSSLRLIYSHTSGTAEPLAELFAEGRRATSLSRRPIDVARLATETEGEIIDRFLRLSDLRIVADEGEEEQSVQTEAMLDEEDDLVSEELAEVYLMQGLNMQAIEIYRKLSLLNPEKSIYFAEKIGQITKNK
ncbi:MAG: hypothetical protein IJ348_03835 [Alistipes sp.]|nr:hypothetical protein [Alistipes sp.]